MPLAPHVASAEIALEQLAARAREIYGIECKVLCEAEQVNEELSVAQQLYRIAQEGVLNAVRHGRASSVSIFLGVSESGGSVRMILIDNGEGIDEERIKRGAGVGLRIMRHRCRSIGLDMKLERHPEGGTILRIE